MIKFRNKLPDYVCDDGFGETKLRWDFRFGALYLNGKNEGPTIAEARKGHYFKPRAAHVARWRAQYCVRYQFGDMVVEVGGNTPRGALNNMTQMLRELPRSARPVAEKAGVRK